MNDKNETTHPEYVPDGPVVIARTAKDERKKINKDGTPSSIPVERPAYADDASLVVLDLARRIGVLEAQVKSLQMQARTGVK